MAESGLGERVDVRLQGYRELVGERFDAMASTTVRCDGFDQDGGTRGRPR